MKFRRLTALASGLAMLLLILDAKTALDAGREGLQLCLQTVIPSLFPFFVCSVLLTGSLPGGGSRILAPIAELFRIPPGSEGILLTGLLGGYPIGAQCVRSAWSQGVLTRSQAQRMLMFCNQAGPAFLFGILGQQFDSPFVPWLIWAVQLLSALLVARMVPAGDLTPIKAAGSSSASIPSALMTAVKAMANVCGWVILFRVILGFFSRWVLWLLPIELQILVSGMLELTNGCTALHQIPSEGLRFVMACAMLSFGGLCVAMQTQSVIGPLGSKAPIFGKLLQLLLSIPLAAGVYGLRNEGIALWWIMILPVFFRKSKKRDSAQAASGV